MKRLQRGLATTVVMLALVGGSAVAGTAATAASAGPGHESAARTLSADRHGVVRWWNAAKGFGFITYWIGRNVQEVFVHYTSVAPGDIFRMHAGAKVEFSVRQGPKGLTATDVHVVGG